MKIAPGRIRKRVLVSYLIYFGEIQVWLRLPILNLNACKLVQNYDCLPQILTPENSRGLL